MTPADLTAAGVRLYGERWQSSLSAALGVSPRIMRRWLSGAVLIPAGVAADLSALEGIARNRATREEARRARQEE